MSENKQQNENVLSLADEVTPDLEGFLEAGQAPDCEERIFTIRGTEVTTYGAAK